MENKAKGQPSIVDDFMYGSNVAASSVNIRLGFLRKVYGILSAQLALTVLICIATITIEPLQTFVQSSQWLVIVLFLASMGLIFALMLKSKEVPTNYYLLAAFTVVEALMVGIIVTFYQVHSVIEAAVLTCGVTIGLTTYAMQTKRDYSPFYAGAFACLWILIGAGFFQLVFQSEMLDKAIGVAGALLFSLFIIIDTQLIMSKVSAEEYIHASILLYLDIINLFIHILRILGERKN